MKESLLKLLAFFCLGLALAFLLQCSNKVKESGSAPNFTLKSLENQEMTLTSLKGKVVLLDFWATWCAPCREAIPHLVELYKNYKDKGLVVIGMNVDRGEGDVVRRFVKSMEIPYPILLAPEEIVRNYGVNALPTTVLVDKEGKIREKIVGFNSNIAKKMVESVGEVTSEKP
jgi:thiol-disulfide isomerase/thioredoxin